MTQPIHRRGFLKGIATLGAAAALPTFLGACTDDEEPSSQPAGLPTCSTSATACS